MGTRLYVINICVRVRTRAHVCISDKKNDIVIISKKLEITKTIFIIIKSTVTPKRQYLTQVISLYNLKIEDGASRTLGNGGKM